jgi:hypothetical protein
MRRKLPFFLIFLLPIIVIFDLFLYFLNRSSCLNCGNLIEFFKTGSLTVFLLSQILNIPYGQHSGKSDGKR